MENTTNNCNSFDESANPYPEIGEYYQFLSKGDHNNLTFVCMKCIPKKRIRTNKSSISNLRRHLARRHSQYISDFNYRRKNKSAAGKFIRHL